jgi:hypothetical protein
MPYGYPEIVEKYLQKKLRKHEQPLDFISIVANMRYSREAHKMLMCLAVPRLTHIVKSVSKDDAATGWMTTVDEAHLSTWLDCTGASTLGLDVTPQKCNHLSASLDQNLQFGGIGMQSLIKAADEELLGACVLVSANLIVFLRTKGLSGYDRLGDAPDVMVDNEEDAMVPIIQAVTSLVVASARAHTFLFNMTQIEIDFATSLTLGERLVEIPGRYSPLVAHTKP